MKIKKKLICQMTNGTDYGFPTSVEGTVEKHAPVTGLFALMRNDKTGAIEDCKPELKDPTKAKAFMSVRGILRDERAMMERACEV